MATILFVDDEPHLLLPDTIDLREAKHEVKFITRGALTEEFLRQNHADVVVLDSMFGYEKFTDDIDREPSIERLRNDQWTGIRVYDRLVKEFPNQKIIFRTVKTEAEVHEYARAHYPDLNITAPIFTKGSPEDKEFVPTLLKMLKQK